MARLSDKLGEIVVTSNPQTAGLAGEIRPFAGDTSAWPVVDGVRQLKGWAVCEGDILNEADYPDLCANLGGVGNSPWDNFDHPLGQTGTVGAGQFRLPKLNGLHLKSAGDNGNGNAACGDFQDQGTAANNLTATTQVGGTSVNVGSHTVTSTGNKNQFNSNQNTHRHQMFHSTSVTTVNSSNPSSTSTITWRVNNTTQNRAYAMSTGSGTPNSGQNSPEVSTWASSNFSVSGSIPTVNRSTATANRTATIDDNNDETRPTSVAVSYIIALYNNVANVVSTKDLTASNVTVTGGLTTDTANATTVSADNVSATTYSGLPVADGSTDGIVTTGAQTIAGNKTFSGTVDANTVSANTYSGLPVAGTSTSGIVSTGAQTFAGNKDFNGNVEVGQGIDYSRPSSPTTANSQFTLNGNGYRGFITLGSSGMVMGQNSGNRVLSFSCNEITGGTLGSTGYWTFGPTNGSFTHSFNGLVTWRAGGGFGQTLGIRQATNSTRDRGYIIFSNQGGSTALFYGNDGNLRLGGVTSIANNGGNDGGVVVGSQTSDARIKENITNLESSLNIVMSLSPKKYTKYGVEEVGFLAQDVQELVPEAVYDTKLPLEQIEADDENYAPEENQTILAMQYNQLIPVLTKAIQEQQEQIEALKAEIELLKN